MRKKQILFFSVIVVALSVLSLLPLDKVSAQEIPVQFEHKIEICHASASQTNPYGPQKIEVDKNATAGGHDDHDGGIWFPGIKTRWGDIIPSYEILECEKIRGELACQGTGKFYPGKNWTTRGQAIWRNNCQIPEYKACSVTVDRPMKWSDWMLDPNNHTQEFRTRVIIEVDSRNNQIPCGRRIDKETRYIECSSTIRVSRGWSKWKDDPNDETQEMREKTVYIMDSQDQKVQCAEPVAVTETRYKVCSRTVRSYGEWSDWMVDPNDETQEYREREAIAVDSQDSEVVCAGPVVLKEYRDIEEEYESCEYTQEVYGEWSSWMVDPNDNTQEYRERTITSVDSEDNSIQCGTTVEKGYRDIVVEDEGEVLGASTSIVYANTAGEENLSVYMMEYLMIIVTGIGFIVLGKKYYNR